MKRLIAVLLSLVLIFALCSCDVDEIKDETYVIDEPAPEVEIYIPNNSVFGVAYAPNESADPYSSPSGLNSELMGLICEPLFELTPSFSPEPCLCSEYSYTDRTFTIIIKDGVTFSDGTKLTAADVKYSLDCAMEPSSYYATRLSVIDSISYSNRSRKVTLNLKYANARIASLLDIPIIKKGTRAELLPTGTGIYAPNENLTALTARENHHSGKTPKYSTITLYGVSGSDELLYKFDNKNVSVLSNDPTGTVPHQPAILMDVRNVPTTQMHFIGFNLNNPLFSDPAVRKMIARAIDRESAATSDFALMGRPSTLPVHPLSGGYPTETAQKLSYDKEMKTLSISEPLTILVNSENNAKLVVCKRIAETLSRLGTPTTVRALPFEEYTQALSAGDYTLYYGEIALGADFDITRLLTGSLNFGNVHDANLIAKHSAYLTGDEARSDYFEAFAETVPFAPIMFKDITMCTEKNFFLSASPTAHNIYHNFTDWTIGG